MTADYARSLVDYTYWARDRVLRAVEPLEADQYTRDLGNSFKSIHDTLVHLYGAEWVWYSRWTGVSPTALPAPSEFPDLPALVADWQALEHQVRSFVDRLDDAGLHRPVEYMRANGGAERSTFAQMIAHVVNHGTYHRGQVTTLLRQLGAAVPESTDLIVYFRDREASLLGGRHG